MPASRPPPPSKRPWYLVAALVGGWVYGAQALSEGYEAIAFYRGEQTDVHAMADPIADTSLRDVAVAAGERWLAMKQSSQERELPIGAATLLLGAAMVLLSARSMTGREGARSALVQVVLVHAGVVVAGYFLTAAVARADAEFRARIVEGLTHTLNPPAIQERADRWMEAVSRVQAPIETAIQTLFSGLIVLALTRPRVRAFFPASPPPGPVGEG
jgi:hypothetical protein